MGEPLRSWGLPKWSKWRHWALEMGGFPGSLSGVRGVSGVGGWGRNLSPHTPSSPSSPHAPCPMPHSQPLIYRFIISLRGTFFIKIKVELGYECTIHC